LRHAAWEHLVVIEDDPEARIAALQRQLAELKAELRGNHGGPQPPQFVGPDAEDGAEARRRAEALLESLRSGRSAGPDGPSTPEIAQLREAFTRAASDAGMSPNQVDEVLKHGRVTIKTGHGVSYSGPGSSPRFNTPAGSQSGYPQTFGQGPGFRRRPRQRLSGADRVGAVIGMIGGLLGLCVGGAAALTAMFPSSAPWMSGIVCRSPYHLGSSTSDYSYKPGQSGTSVSFQCVSDASWYPVNMFVVTGLQSVLAALIVGVVAVIVRRVLRRTRNR
jgi:hypothetical protein